MATTPIERFARFPDFANAPIEIVGYHPKASAPAASSTGIKGPTALYRRSLACPLFQPPAKRNYLPICGIVNSAPARIDEGQRCVTALYRV